MKLTHGLHLAYCTNIHRGEDWPETLEALERYTLAVREKVCPDAPYAIGLRLSDLASRQLSEPRVLRQFQQWLREKNCYVFTINGFPYGRFHGARVKEQVYRPDWTAIERLEYTNRLFDILAELLPEGVEGSVSTVPCSFKEFITTPNQVGAMRDNLWRCIEHIAALSARTGQQLHLGLEPEPLCFLETSAEAVEFIEQMRADRPGDLRLNSHLGVNYDTCHLAIEYEQPQEGLLLFQSHGIRISKLHLSSALKVRPLPQVCKALRAFADDIYFHQVIERRADGSLHRFKDLDQALRRPPPPAETPNIEWRIHFHIPLHSRPSALFESTAGHLLGVLDQLQENPAFCSHLEMETYTWEVMPPELKNRSVVDQLVAEYDWTLRELGQRGFVPSF
jgi:sugar phosphate isomerase/epimerase